MNQEYREWKANHFMIVEAPFVGLYDGKPVAHAGGVGNRTSESLEYAQQIASDHNAVPVLVAACESALKFLGGNAANPAIGDLLRTAICKARGLKEWPWQPG